MPTPLSKAINHDDARLAEMTKIKEDNQKILDAIRQEQQALNEDKQKFEVYKDEQRQMIATDRENLRKEAAAHDVNVTEHAARVKQFEQDNMHKV